MPDFMSRIISSKLLFFFFSAIFLVHLQVGWIVQVPTMIAKLQK